MTGRCNETLEGYRNQMTATPIHKRRVWNGTVSAQSQAQPPLYKRAARLFWLAAQTKALAAP